MSPNPEAASAGQQLAEARESMGITQREVSDALNLAITTVDAIEAGDLSRLPALVFTRGYVRAYAKLLELDADELVAAWGDSTAEPAHEAEPESGPAHKGSEDMLPPGLDIHHLLRPRNLAVAAGVLLTLVVLVVILIGGDDGRSADVESSADSPAVRAGEAQPEDGPSPAALLDAGRAEAPPAQTTAAGNAAQMIDDLQAQILESAEPAPVQTQDPVQTQGRDVEPMQAIAVADPAQLPVRTDDARRLTDSGDDRLSLVFTEDCWVEIKSTGDRTLFADLGRAGQQLEFVGAGPFRVLLGYAPGVLLKFNDEPVALTPHTRNNVASLVLGQ